MSNVGISREYNLVKDFHKSFNHPFSETPKSMEMDRATSRYSWMLEEINEFLEAVHDEDIVEQADAMIDVIYFALGTLVEIGVDPQPLFDIVQNANMSKLWSDGKAHYYQDGKVMKPEGWEDPHPKLVVEVERQSSITSYKI